MIERRALDARLQAENEQLEQEQIDLERLRNLLHQADEKLAAANQVTCTSTTYGACICSWRCSFVVGIQRPSENQRRHTNRPTRRFCCNIDMCTIEQTLVLMRVYVCAVTRGDTEAEERAGPAVQGGAGLPCRACLCVRARV